MRSAFRLGVVAFLGITVVCCGEGVRGSGKAATERREVPEFRRLAFNGDGHAQVTLGVPRSVTITTDDNLLPLVETSVADGRLTVQPHEPIRPRTDLLVEIGLPALDGVSLAGNTTVEVPGIEGERFEISITGYGVATVAGRTQRLETRITGNGVIRAAELRAEDARVTVIGAGEVALHAEETLHVAIQGSGDVRYAGAPRITQEIDGAATVEPLR